MKKLLLSLLLAVPLLAFGQAPIVRQWATTNGPATVSNIVKSIMAPAITNGDVRGVTISNTLNSPSVGLRLFGDGDRIYDIQQWFREDGVVLGSIAASGAFTGNGSGLSNVTASAFPLSADGNAANKAITNASTVSARSFLNIHTNQSAIALDLPGQEPDYITHAAITHANNTNSPSSTANNDILNIGFNSTGSGRIDQTRPGFGMNFEPNWLNATTYQSEWYTYYTPTNGPSRRPYSFAALRPNGTDIGGSINSSMDFDILSIQNGVDAYQMALFSSSGRRFYLYSDMMISLSNSVPIADFLVNGEYFYQPVVATNYPATFMNVGTVTNWSANTSTVDMDKPGQFNGSVFLVNVTNASATVEKITRVQIYTHGTNCTVGVHPNWTTLDGSQTWAVGSNQWGELTVKCLSGGYTNAEFKLFHFQTTSVPTTAGVQYWWHANDVTNADNVTLTTWTDRVSSLVLTGENAAVITAPWTNGLKAVRFVSSYYTNLTAINLAQPYTVMAVFYPSGSSPTGFLLDGTSAGTRVIIDQEFSGSAADANKWSIYAGGTALTVATPGPTNAWTTFGGVFNDSSSVIYTNSVVAASSGSAIGTRALTTFRVGADSSMGGSERMDLADLLIFPSALTQAQMTDVHNYFRNMYGQGTATVFPGEASFSGTVLANTITATNGYFLPTNALSAWPTRAATPGGAWMGNSNATVYLLTSTPGSTTWAATNKIAP